MMAFPWHLSCAIFRGILGLCTEFHLASMTKCLCYILPSINFVFLQLLCGFASSGCSDIDFMIFNM